MCLCTTTEEGRAMATGVLAGTSREGRLLSFTPVNAPETPDTIMPRNDQPHHVLSGLEKDIVNLVHEEANMAQGARWPSTPLELAGTAGNVSLVKKIPGVRVKGGAVSPAARAGNLKLVRDLPAAGAPAIEKDRQGSTPLHHAVVLGSEQITQLLMQQGGASAKNALDKKGRTALHLAAKHGRIAAVEILLAAGVDVRRRFGDDECSALDLAVFQGHVDVVKALVQHGADVRSRTETVGRTPLHVAALGDRPNVIHALVEAGARVNEVDYAEGQTPLHVAAGTFSTKAIIALLQHGAYKNKVDHSGRSPLHLVASRAEHSTGALSLQALKADCVSAASALVAAGADVGLRYGDDKLSVLECAVLEGTMDVLRVLVEHGVDVNDVDSEGRGALHKMAAGTGMTIKHDEEAEVIGVLVEAGADLDALQDEIEGLAPLHIACETGNHEVVLALLHHGASKDTLNGAGQSPLYVAVENDNITTVDALLAAGVDANIRSDYNEYSALDCAACSGEVDTLRVLVQHGVDVDAVDSKGRGALHKVAAADGHSAEDVISTLVQLGVEVDQTLPSVTKQTALHIASEHGNLDVVRALLQHGADKDMRDSKGRAPLHLALGWCTSGHLDVIVFLLHHGVDVNTADSKSLTPLHHAVTKNDQAAVVALVEAGADVNSKDKSERSPLYLACDERNSEAVPVLLRRANANMPDDAGKASLRVAIMRGHLEGVTALLAAGASLYSVFDECSMLGYAADFWDVPILEALIQHGADVDAAVAVTGDPILHLAASRNNIDVLNLLLKSGAAVDYVDDNGRTALHFAVDHLRLDAALSLLQGGASVNQEDYVGDSALQIAAFMCQAPAVVGLVSALLKWGADETAVNDAGYTPAEVAENQAEDEECWDDNVIDVLRMLANAPANRAWRRRGFFVLSRFRQERVRKGLIRSAEARTKVREQGGATTSSGAKRMRTKKTGGGEGVDSGAIGDGGAAIDDTGVPAADDMSAVAGLLLGVAEEGIFRNVVCFL